ncbi:SSU ribosomal protein S1p [hydrothermal vent metagenome]|uniref:Small ribosomal subunit protein bS1 n=1 Tax=hydrothermal vent metagenome TaxID=652676 RepID=A0A3B0TXB0_9ZZZZ
MVEPSVSEMNPSREDFAAMLDASLGKEALAEGRVITGKVIAVENDLAVIDVGLKTEGRVPLKEFMGPGQDVKIAVGDEVEVFLDRVENALGEAVLSREKAKREESWVRLEKSFEDNEKVTGFIFGRVKGGFTVNLDGAIAFLPGSQVDIRPVRDIGPLLNTPQPFQILKMDKRRGNIVVSRRAILEETRAEQRQELVQNLKEGQVIEGVVKNITDYGAFVDLGGIDGLLHVTDIAWKRVNHPTDVLAIGETVKVQIVRINSETQRISLGMKQLESDPWDGVEAKYPVGTRFTGTVTNITDYGAFVELEPGVEGLVHVSEMSWVKKNIHPGKIVSTTQAVEVMVLEVDPVKRRISLGLKQCLDNPWEDFVTKFPVGTIIEGEVKNTTEFGLFIGLDGDVDGMVHLSDIDWNRPGEEAIAEFEKGQMVKAKILDIDVDKERISLGIKQLEEDPFKSADAIKRGDIVTCFVRSVKDGGLDVTIGEDGPAAFIRRSDLSRERNEQRPERFAVGDKVDARVTQVDRATRRFSLSIKALEIAEEKEAVAQYGSSDSGASLGDILGAALSRAQNEEEENGKGAGDEPASKSKSDDKGGDDKEEAPAEAKTKTKAKPKAKDDAGDKAKGEAGDKAKGEDDGKSES